MTSRNHLLHEDGLARLVEDIKFFASRKDSYRGIAATSAIVLFRLQTLSRRQEHNEAAGHPLSEICRLRLNDLMKSHTLNHAIFLLEQENSMEDSTMNALAHSLKIDMILLRDMVAELPGKTAVAV